MGINVEKDMQVREVKAEYKYVEKLYALYPLIGNAIISDTNIEKINTQAKNILDKLIENPSAFSGASINCSLFIALTTVNYAKKWNAQEESRFTRYITLQFGYRDDTGKVWGMISKCIERAFGAKTRFFLKDKAGREFYETILVHSFSPENSWDSMFDLLYDFLKNNLRWNYIKGDPIVNRMIMALNHKMNGNTSDDEDLIISSSEYRVRIGAKRLLQNRPEYAAELVDHILNRINNQVHGDGGEPKQYIDQIVDAWFEKKISKMVSSEKQQISRTSYVKADTALSYSKIRVNIYNQSEKLYVHIPAIRLESTGHQYAEIRVLETDRIIGRNVPEIFGNELGETITGCEIPLSVSMDSRCNFRVQILCDEKVVFDSNKSLYRALYVFKGGKESSINSLKPGIYELYIPDYQEYSFENVNILEKKSRYIKAEFLSDFVMYRGDKIVALDTSNIQETTISEPRFVGNVKYYQDGERFEIVEADEKFKIYCDKQKSGGGILFYCDGEKQDIGDYFIEEDVYEISLGDLLKQHVLNEISVIELESNLVIYKKSFLMVDKISAHFDKKYYVTGEDYEGAYLNICIDGVTEQIYITSNMNSVVYEYAQGELEIKVPSVTYEWEGMDRFYSGSSIWKDDITEQSKLSIIARNIGNAYVEIGGNRIGDKNIALFDIVQREEGKVCFNSPIVLIVEERRVNIGQIIYSEMFTKPPMIKSSVCSILWDAGINFIGDKSVGLSLQLYSDEEEKYNLILPFDESEIELPEEFEDGEYTYVISRKTEKEENVFAQGIQFFGNPNKFRFKDKNIEISLVTEDVGEGSRPQEIKPFYIEKIRFVERTYVPSEDRVFDVYEGQMYFVRLDGSKKYYSRNYAEKGNVSFYKVNPVKIIYINERILRIVNEDDEGLYCYDNYGTSPRLEMTDREPSRVSKDYKDILFYLYGTNAQADRTKRIAATEKIKVVRDSKFDKFEKISQSYVIEDDVSKRIMINAGPGTGKTWTLIEKLINMVDVQGVDPEGILVLCFSRAAVEVIKNRLARAAEEERVSEIINLVDVRTFDSFASQVLYWIKNESEYDNLQYQDIGKLNYEERIRLFISTIKDLPEVISQCEHLVVDEVQDLVKERARMVLEMIRVLPEESGVTLLGDSCQAIYDYQIGNDVMSSNQFYTVICERTPHFSYYTFDRNYRQNDTLALIGDGYRDAILSGNTKECDKHWNTVIDRAIQKYEVYSIVDVQNQQIDKLLQEGTVGILTRTNGQALKISAALRDKGINHVLRKRLSDNSLGMWVALIFNTYGISSINKDEFVNEYINLFSNVNCADPYDIWNALRNTIKNSSERIGIRELLRGLVSNARNPILYAEEKEAKLTVTNTHRGKGREFDTVLVENDIFEESEKSLEEHKVCYVALTRPRSSIYRVDAKAEFMRIDKEGERRSYKSGFGYKGQHLSYFEVGLEGDVDLRSFVRTEGTQEFIRDNYDNLIDRKILLSKDNSSDGHIRYKITDIQTGTIFGYTGVQFADSLSRALHSIYRLPSSKSLYYTTYPQYFTDVYVDDVISVVDQADGSETGVKEYGEMIVWNAISIVGYCKARYE